MALTNLQRRRAVRAFCREAYSQDRSVARLDVAQIATAVTELDAWLDAAPVVGPLTNLDAIEAALTPALGNRLNPKQLAILFAATLRARVNAKSVERGG